MPDAREARGQVLVEMQGQRIKHIEGSLWFVPSTKGGGYIVDTDTDHCGCPDEAPRCKHVVAVEIVRAIAEGAHAPIQPPRLQPRGDLTRDEQANTRAALRFLKIRYGGWDALAKATRFSHLTLERLTGKRALSASLAVRLARLAGVPVDDVLTGRFPPAGMCPHCGRGP